MFLSVVKVRGCKTARVWCALWGPRTGTEYSIAGRSTLVPTLAIAPDQTRSSLSLAYSVLSDRGARHGYTYIGCQEWRGPAQPSSRDGPHVAVIVLHRLLRTCAACILFSLLSSLALLAILLLRLTAAMLLAADGSCRSSPACTSYSPACKCKFTCWPHSYSR